MKYEKLSAKDKFFGGFKMDVNIKCVEITRGWVLLSISSLALAGLFAILLVMARTPFFHEIMPWKDFFRTALIIHVNLSVLVWLLSFTCAICTNISVTRINFLDYLSLAAASIGTLLFSISPFLAESEPLINNYVPILKNEYFFDGLALFGAGVSLQLLLTLLRLIIKEKGEKAEVVTCNSSLKFGIYSSAFMSLIAAICFYLSYQALQAPDLLHLKGSEEYYEMLFWGGGHVLQYSYTQIMLVAWLWVSSVVGIGLNLKPRYITTLFALNLLFVIPSPAIYYVTTITDFEHMDFFTQQMRYGGGIAAFIIGLVIIFRFLRTIGKLRVSAETIALIFSILLFGIGGLLGYMIQGVNVVIPAHYHGSIVGVTLALMGLTFFLLPKLGFKPINRTLASIQPILYGGGQLLHIIGLGWSGGYGVLRKTPGAMETIEAKISMGLMGLGGFISIIGGLIFVIVTFTSVIKSPIFRRR